MKKYNPCFTSLKIKHQSHKKALLQLMYTLTLAFSALFSPFASADGVNSASDTASRVVPLVDTTFIGQVINVPAPRTLVIHYFGECQVPSGHIDYDIMVNNSQISPTHDNTSALCSGPQSPATVGTVVACNVPAGNYNIRVRGHVVGGLNNGLVDDQSLVIEKHEPVGQAPNCIPSQPAL
jgi:hypothetical protein